MSSEADATDPVRAVREWCGLPAADHNEIDIDLETATITTDDAAALARAALAAAPALLARIEAGRALLCEARGWMESLSMQQGRPSKALLKDIDAIDAFLAGKEAPRG